MWLAMSATVTGDASHNSRWGNVNGWRRTLPLPSQSLRVARLSSGVGVLSSIRTLEKQDWLQMSQVFFLYSHINHLVVLRLRHSRVSAASANGHCSQRGLKTPGSQGARVEGETPGGGRTDLPLRIDCQAGPPGSYVFSVIERTLIERYYGIFRKYAEGVTGLKPRVKRSGTLGTEYQCRPL